MNPYCRTYKSIDLYAGANLNLVLGPNGTGKSALVCAIIIGLGGDPSDTGRAGHLGEYIRFGCDSATVEIELFNDMPNAKNYVIQRSIHPKSGTDGKLVYTSTFKLNGKEVNRNKLRDFVHSLNINVNNLCQFLPQERVVEFVKMDRKTLLGCTEKAAGDETMFDIHQQIAALSKEVKKLNDQNADLTNQITAEQDLQARAEEELRRIEERDRFKKEIEWLRKKRPWIEYEDKRVEYEAAKGEVMKKKEEMNIVTQSLKPLQDEVNNARILNNKCEKNRMKAMTDLKKCHEKIDPIKSQIEDMFVKVKDAKTGYFEQMEIENRRRAELNRMETELSTFEDRYNNLEEGVNLEPQIRRVIDDMTAVNGQIANHRKDRMKVMEDLERIVVSKGELDARKRRLEDVFRRRLNKLGELSPQSYQAYEWYTKNRDRFQGTIYPPIMTQIDMKDVRWAKFVESAIKKADLSAFLCEDSDDLKLFTQLLRDECNGLRVNVALAPEQSADHFQPNFDINEYKSYGIFSTVKDMFTAPDKVMAYLCKSAFLHQIPVGDHRTDKNFERLKNNSNFRRVYSTDTLYTITTSRYDGKKVIAQDQCPEARYLNLTGNEKELKRIIGELKQLSDKHTAIKTKVTLIDEKVNELNTNLIELQDEKKKLDDKKNEKRMIETKISQLKEKIGRNKGQGIDADKLKRNTETTISKVEKKMLELKDQLKEKINECVALNDIKAKVVLAESYARLWWEDSRRKLATASEHFQDMRSELDRLTQELNELKHEAKDLRNKARDLSGFDVNDCTEEIRTKFDSLPNDLDEIDNQIGTLRLRMDSIFDADETVRDTFNARKKNIERRRKDLETRKKDMASKVGKLEELKGRWLPALEELISKINDSFSAFMAKIDCAGEVALYTPDNQEAYEEYGISIKVKFRHSEPLRELTSFHQSGGERSVSTMIYMIALQELTKVPFRCVDEINQVLPVLMAILRFRHSYSVLFLA